MKKLIYPGVLGICLTALALSARADTIYNNFGPGNTYNQGVAYVISDGGAGFRQYIANPFTPLGTDFTLTSIDLAAGLGSGANLLIADIRADNLGNPSALLESWTFNNMGPFGADHVLSANSVANPVLSAGSPYWFEVRTNDPTTAAAWNFSLSDAGPFKFSGDGGATWFSENFTRGVYGVSGDPVPEPGTMLLLGSGLLIGLVAGRRRKTRAQRMSQF